MITHISSRVSLYFLWLIRLTNCLKMGWSLCLKCCALLKVNGLVEKNQNKLYFLHRTDILNDLLLTFQIYSPSFIKLFVIILIMHSLFCWINQENVLQKEIKDWAFKVYLLTREPSQFLIPWNHCVNHWKCLVPEPMCSSWIFCQIDVSPKLIKITATSPKQ